MKKLILSIMLLGLSCVRVDSNGTEYSSGYSFRKICVEGHTYYFQTVINQGFLAIKLDSDGKPVRCDR
jgi:hypothetical protein